MECDDAVAGVRWVQMLLMAFAYAQLLYAVALLLGYCVYFLLVSSLPLRFVLPRRLADGRYADSCASAARRVLRDLICRWFSAGLASKAGIFTWQSAEKLLLTEGEKFVLKRSATLVSQDVFATVSSLGSLVARVLFQPVEEMSFVLFSKCFPHGSTQAIW
jgi:oligosaccharide translocation protein RFT1